MEMNENNHTKENVTVISLIAIMAIFLVNRGVNIVTPAMNTFYEHFAEYSHETVAMISTLPNLTLVIGTLIVGAIVGKRFSFKSMAILGSCLYLIGGLLPYFIDDLYASVFGKCRFLPAQGSWEPVFPKNVPIFGGSRPHPFWFIIYIKPAKLV